MDSTRDGGREGKPNKLVIFIVALVAVGLGVGAWLLVEHDRRERQRGIAELAKIQMRSIGEKIEAFRADNGRYPTREEIHGIHGPDYPHQKLIDAWGNGYIYRPDPTGRAWFHLISTGSDGLPGGVDHATDLMLEPDGFVE